MSTITLTHRSRVVLHTLIFCWGLSSVAYADSWWGGDETPSAGSTQPIAAPDANTDEFVHYSPVSGWSNKAPVMHTAQPGAMQSAHAPTKVMSNTLTQKANSAPVALKTYPVAQAAPANSNMNQPVPQNAASPDQFVSYSPFFEGKNKNWHPVVAFGAGSLTQSDAGADAQDFPIQYPTSDAFYNYTPQYNRHTSALFEGFVGAEGKLHTNWLWQLGADYNQASRFSAQGTLVQGVDVPSQDTANYSYQISTKQLLLAGKLLYTVQDIFHPYLFAGVGPAFNEAYNYSTTINPNLTFTRMYNDHTSVSFSYAVGLGLDTNINEHVRLGAGYRFSDLGQVKLGNGNIDGIPVSETLSQSHLYAHELLAQLTWVI